MLQQLHKTNYLWLTQLTPRRIWSRGIDDLYKLGKAVADIPVVLVDMDEGAVKDFVDYGNALGYGKKLQSTNCSGMDRSTSLCEWMSISQQLVGTRCKSSPIC